MGRDGKYRLVDLFCGCGGISRGFEWTGRFGTQLGVEIQRHPALAFKANIRNVAGHPARVYVGDIERLTESPETLWKELNAADINTVGEIDVLAGGPPCQGFSRNGVRLYSDSDKSQRFYDDPRNHLYKSFLRVVELTEPKIVLVENVREFLNFGGGKFSADLVQKFQELGYDVCYRKICAADFGVPQVRHRVFFVAVRCDVAKKAKQLPFFPEPEFFAADEQFTFGSTHRTVRDAISDLPEPCRDRNAALPYQNDLSLSALAQQLRNPAGTVNNHFVRTLSEKQKARINAVGSGRMKHVSKELRTRSFYGSAYRRLAWDEPALTITTWVYHVGSGRFAHPEHDRGITMREAARLQTFDDSFIFPPLVNPVSQMIGNAVPPLLASKFAEAFASVLEAFNGRLLESAVAMNQETSPLST